MSSRSLIVPWSLVLQVALVIPAVKEDGLGWVESLGELAETRDRVCLTDMLLLISKVNRAACSMVGSETVGDLE